MWCNMMQYDVVWWLMTSLLWNGALWGLLTGFRLPIKKHHLKSHDSHVVSRESHDSHMMSHDSHMFTLSISVCVKQPQSHSESDRKDAPNSSSTWNKTHFKPCQMDALQPLCYKHAKLQPTYLPQVIVCGPCSLLISVCPPRMVHTHLDPEKLNHLIL